MICRACDEQIHLTDRLKWISEEGGESCTRSGSRLMWKHVPNVPTAVKAAVKRNATRGLSL